MPRKRKVLYKITQIHKEDGFYQYRKKLVGTIGYWRKDHNTALLKGWEGGTFTSVGPITLDEVPLASCGLYFFAVKTELVTAEK